MSVEDLGDITGIGLTEFYGEFSWGKITLGDRTNAAFDAYTLRGTSGITTGGVVSRGTSQTYRILYNITDK